jgi:hypothetical protein
MTTKVTEQGLLVPKDLLPDVDEVEIRKETYCEDDKLRIKS